MPLTAEEALTIAKRHGLTMTDAVALQRLAGSVEEAEAFARSFAPVPPPVDMNARIRRQAKSAAKKRSAAAGGGQ